MSSYEDIETYKKIAGENGKYLGERAQSEQLLAEKGESEELQTGTERNSNSFENSKISENIRVSENIRIRTNFKKIRQDT